MNIEQIRQADKTMLVPADVAEVLCCDPQLIRIMARQKPELLGFPVCCVGSRVKIPRLPFLQFVEGRQTMPTIQSIEGRTNNEQ